MFCYVETDYMIAGPPMSFGMMKGNATIWFTFIFKIVLTPSSVLEIGTLWGFKFVIAPKFFSFSHHKSSSHTSLFYDSWFFTLIKPTKYYASTARSH